MTQALARVLAAWIALMTQRAVVLSALTTMTGFGSLVFSHNLGTASMGELLTIGMLAVVVPALFRIGRG